MAKIIYTSGEEREMTSFGLKDFQQVVGGYIEIVPTHNGKFLVVNEEGKLTDLPYNEKATLLYKHNLNDQIYGNVVVCSENEIR